MKKLLFVLTAMFVAEPCLAQERPKDPREPSVEAPLNVEVKQAGSKDDFGQVFEGYVQVDESWHDVRIVKSRTATGKAADVGVKFTSAPLASVVERVEPAVIEWVSDDEDKWIFIPVAPVDMFERIVVKVKDQVVWAEKIVDDRVLAFEAKEVTDATRCLYYRCGVLYRFDPKPVSCTWLGQPKKDENCWPK